MGLLNRGMNKQYKVILLSTCAAAFFSGCGGGSSSNPVKDHQELINESKTSVASDIDVTQLSPYSVKIYSVGDETGKNTLLEFTEGKSAEYRFAAIVNDGYLVKDVKYNLKGNNLPAGATLVKDSTKPNQWILKWAPERGTVKSNQTSISNIISLEISDIETTDEMSQVYLNHATLKSEFTIQTVLNDDVPQFKASEGFLAQYTESEMFPITLTVQDLGGHELLPPSFERVNRVSDCKEGQCFIDGADYLAADPKKILVESVRNGLWKINLVLDLKNKALPTFSQARNKTNEAGLEGLPMEISLRVRGGRGLYTATITKRAFVVYKSKGLKPIFSLNENYVVPVLTGVPSVVSLMASSVTTQGKLTVDEAALKASLASSKGSQSTVSCKDVSDERLKKVCNITFNLPCGVAGNEAISFQLPMKATHNINGVSTSATRNIRIQISEGGACKTRVDNAVRIDQNAKARIDALNNAATAAKEKAAAAAKRASEAKAKVDPAIKALADAKVKADATAKVSIAAQAKAQAATGTSKTQAVKDAAAAKKTAEDAKNVASTALKRVDILKNEAAALQISADNAQKASEVAAAAAAKASSGSVAEPAAKPATQSAGEKPAVDPATEPADVPATQTNNQSDKQSGVLS